MGKLVSLLVLFSIWFSSSVYCFELDDKSSYIGTGLSSFVWSQNNSTFNDGVLLEARDKSGIALWMGYRFNRYVSAQIDFAYYANMYQESYNDWLFSGELETYGAYTLFSMLLHYPIKRILPFIGIGGGIMRLPYSDGIEFGVKGDWVWQIQTGVHVFITQNWSLYFDAKFIQMSIDNLNENLDGTSYNFGLQYNF